MKVVIAAAVSVALHVGVVLVVMRPLVAPSPPVAKVPKPVQVEVIRLAGVLAPSKRAAPVVAAVAAPAARRVVSRPVIAVGPGPTVAAEEPVGAAQPEAAPVEGTGTAVVEAKEVAPAPAALDTTALSRRLQQVALRCYPAAARRFRQTGEAHVRFCVDGAGGLRESKVVLSAGSDLLDHAASDCVVPGAAPFAVETYERCFTVPVRFSP